MSEVRKCNYCGAEYVARTSRQKFCSASCKRKHGYRVYYARKTGKYDPTKRYVAPTFKKCLYCGEEFQQRRSAQKYCSHNCAVKAYKYPELDLIQDADDALIQDQTDPCEVCKRIFSSTPQERKSCSPDCPVKRILASRQELIADLTPPPTRKCHDCGKPTNNYRCPICLAKWRKIHKVKSSQNSDASLDDIYYI